MTRRPLSTVADAVASSSASHLSEQEAAPAMSLEHGEKDTIERAKWDEEIVSDLDSPCTVLEMPTSEEQQEAIHSNTKK